MNLNLELSNGDERLQNVVMENTDNTQFDEEEKGSNKRKLCSDKSKNQIKMKIISLLGDFYKKN